jgi:hypothetical protein
MPMLKVLDLENSYDHVFSAYHQWTREKTSILPNVLEAIFVGMIDTKELVSFLQLHGAQDSRDGTNLTLRTVGMDPRMANWEIEQYIWLRNHIGNLILRRYIVQRPV